VTLTLVATPNTYENTSDISDLLVFTDPTSWLDEIALSDLDSTDGAMDGGQNLTFTFDEAVDLTTQAESAKPEGNASYPIMSISAQSIYGGMGGSGGSAYTIVAAEYGTSRIRTAGVCIAVAGWIQYVTKCKKFSITNMEAPKIIVSATQEVV
jgi:hypothetical protein